MLGFSPGACYALDLAAADPEHIRSVVIFYGTGGGDYSNSRAAYLGHFAENDEFEPQSNGDNLEETLTCAGRPVTFYRYSGTGHWFFEPDRPEAYNQDCHQMQSWRPRIVVISLRRRRFAQMFAFAERCGWPNICPFSGSSGERVATAGVGNLEAIYQADPQ